MQKGNQKGNFEEAVRAVSELLEVAGPERGVQRMVYAILEAVNAREGGRPLRTAELGDAELIALEKLGLL